MKIFSLSFPCLFLVLIAVFPLAAVSDYTYVPDHFIIKFLEETPVQMQGGYVYTGISHVDTANIRNGITSFEHLFVIPETLTPDDPFFEDGCQNVYIFKANHNLNIPEVVAEYLGDDVDFCEGDALCVETEENQINNFEIDKQAFYENREKMMKYLTKSETRRQPVDPEYPLQWYLRNTGQRPNYPTSSWPENTQVGYVRGVDINAEPGWEVTTGHPYWVVAVISDGLNYSNDQIYGHHPDMDIRDRICAGYNCLHPGDPPFECNDWDHQNGGYNGQVWAALIGAKSDNYVPELYNITGVDWHCRIMPIKVWHWNPQQTKTSDIARGIGWASTQPEPNRAHVIYVEPAIEYIEYSMYSAKALQLIIGDGLKRGCITVAPCFSTSHRLLFPGIYPETLSVTGIWSDGSWFGTPYDNRYTENLKVSAPMDNIWSLQKNTYDPLLPEYSSRIYGSTTTLRMSAALVAGIASLTFCAHCPPNYYPDWSDTLSVFNQICVTCRDWIPQNPGWDKWTGYGMVDLAAAVGPYVSTNNTNDLKSRVNKTFSLFTYPNPTRNHIRFELSFDYNPNRETEIKIYDVSGKLIRKMSNYSTSQQQKIDWDCCDGQGTAVSKGIYIITALNEGVSKTKRVIVTR